MSDQSVVPVQSRLASAPLPPSIGANNERRALLGGTSMPVPGKFGGSAQSGADDSVMAALRENSAYIRYFSGEKVTKGATPMQAGVSVMKLVVGVGSFALPRAFKLAGMLGGVLGILIVAGWCAYSVSLMTQCRADCGPRAGYYDVVRRSFGDVAVWSTYLAGAIASFGSCAAYIAFMAPLGVSLLGNKYTTDQVALVGSAVLCLLAWIPSFKYLAYTSVLGDFAFLTAMITVFVSGFTNHSVNLHHPALEVDTFPQFLGAAVFLYGICLFILPVQQSMEHPRKFQKAVNFSYGATAIVNILFGLLGYALWGDSANGNIINSMVPGTFKDMAMTLLCFDLIFSYPIVLAVGRELVERGLLGNSKWVEESKFSYLVRMAIRAVLVFGSALFALKVQSFLSIVGLVSGLALVLTSLLLPAMCYLQFYWATLSMESRVGHTVLVLIGGIAAVFTTVQAAQSL